eukprot:13239559-Alexandrium_andersonii.AAC.1
MGWRVAQASPPSRRSTGPPGRRCWGRSVSPPPPGLAAPARPCSSHSRPPLPLPCRGSAPRL